MVSLSATKLSLGRQWKALQHAHARACTRRRCHRASGSCSKPSHVCGKSCIATACPAAPTQGARGPSLFGRGRILATGCNVRHVTSHVRRGPAPPRKRKPPALPRDARTECRQRPVAAGLQHSAAQGSADNHSMDTDVVSTSMLCCDRRRIRTWTVARAVFHDS